MADPTTSVSIPDLSDIESEFKGEILRPGTPAFGESRYIFNTRWVGRDPALIVKPKNTEEVASVMRYASARGIPVGIRSGGGHGVDGSAMPEGQLVIDLSAFKDIEFDLETLQVTLGPGVVLGEMDTASEAHGLVVPAGTVSNTGVAGLALGGGVGYNMRRFGATVDSMLSCEVVTADGRVVTASKTENPDLFWALRGAGHNYGVVTSLTFQAHKAGPIVGGGAVIYHLEDAPAVLKKLREYMKTAPRELSMIAALVPTPPMPGVPEEYYGVVKMSLLTVYTGDLANLDSVVGELAALGTPAAVAVQPMPWHIVNSILDEAAPYGRRVHTRGGYFEALTDEIIEITTSRAAIAPPPEVPGPSTVQNIWFMGGAISEDFDEDSVSFSREGAGIFWESVAQWDSPENDDTFAAWVDGNGDTLQPLMLGNGYCNLTTDRGPEWLSRLYGKPAKWERLVDLKTKWDPQNLFRFNKNIKPKGA